MLVNPPNAISRKKEPELLLIATSARVLLESAIRGGYSVAVIDGFCDREVAHHASVAKRVGLSAEGGLDDSELADAIMKIKKRYTQSLKTLVTGSGIESCEIALAAIRQSNLLWLNNREPYHRSLRYKDLKLQSDKIVPIPDNQAPYLYKSIVGSGGTHIYKSNRSQCVQTNYYRQSYLPLTSVSHLFLADGNQIETIAFSTQWHSKHDATHPFCYGGAINAHTLSDACITQAEAIAETLDLVGMNNIDYLYDGTKLYMLELNSRPSATMTLYDNDYAKGLLHAHIEACEGGGLVQRTKISPTNKAFAIVYTNKAIRLPNDFEWPTEAKDIPIGNSTGYCFERNTPICTVYAEANDVGTTLADLQNQIRNLRKRISQISETIEPFIDTEHYHETPEYFYQ